MRGVLEIRLSDLFRATLPDECGNDGYLGIAPDGSRYHVVVPVDRKISRGLKFWINPADGTPFGGYKDWHYFRCLTYGASPLEPEKDLTERRERARQNGRLVQKWAQSAGLPIRIREDME